MTIRDLLSHMANDIRQEIELLDKHFRRIYLSVKLNNEEEQDNELLDLVADNQIDEWYIDHNGRLVIYIDGDCPALNLNPYMEPAEYVSFGEE